MNRLWVLLVEFVGRIFCWIFGFSDLSSRCRPVEFRHRSKHPRGLSERRGEIPGLALWIDSDYFGRIRGPEFYCISWIFWFVEFLVFLVDYFGQVSVVMVARCRWLVQVWIIVWAHGFWVCGVRRGAGFRKIHVVVLPMPFRVTVSTSFRAEATVDGLPARIQVLLRPAANRPDWWPRLFMA